MQLIEVTFDIPLEQHKLIRLFERYSNSDSPQKTTTPMLLNALGKSVVEYFCTNNQYPFFLENWKTHPQGKPYLQNGPHFNISHSNSKMLVCFHPSEVGVDIQFNRNPAPFQLIQRFHDLEIKWFEQQNEKTEAFYTLWTKKEAFLKAIGTGIRRGLKTDNCTNNCVIDHHMNTWYFHLINCDDNYSRCICTTDIIQALPEIQQINLDFILLNLTL